MPIDLNDGAAALGTPVLRQQRIGEIAMIAIVRTEQRDRLRRDPASNQMVRIPNGTDRNGQPKFKQEMVVHGITMPGTTMEAGIGDHRGVPAPGDRVRLILKAKGFGDWIEARRNHRGGGLQVGDRLVLETDHAQQYDQAGNPKGPKINDQAAADATPRGVTIGFYGPLTLLPGDAPDWIQRAEDAYHADKAAEQQRNAINLDPSPQADGYGSSYQQTPPPPVAAPASTPSW